MQPKVKVLFDELLLSISEVNNSELVQFVGYFESIDYLEIVHVWFSGVLTVS